MTHANVTPIRSEWLPTQEACERLGVTRRTLQRRANAGRIESRQNTDDGRTHYKVPATPATATTHRDDAATATHPVSHHDAPTGRRAELAYLRAALVDAERRAAVAEYRAELAETERDAARDRVRELRTGTVARLARRVAELTQDD
jgi:excisionase family DNA binding protein